jgi:hypothetical protein
MALWPRDRHRRDLLNLQSPIPGTRLTGSPSSISPIPVRVAVSTFFPGGPVPGAEIRVESDRLFPPPRPTPTASVLTNASGIGVCSLQFGNTTGQGKQDPCGRQLRRLRAIIIPVRLEVRSGPPPTGPPAGATGHLLSHFFISGPISQTVAVVSASGSVTYTRPSGWVLLRSVGSRLVCRRSCSR